MFEIAIGSAALAAALPADESRRGVVLAGPVVVLGDLIDIVSVPPPLRDQAARIQIARIPAGNSRIVTRAFVLGRVRAQFPLLGAWAEANVVRDHTVAYRPGLPALRHMNCLRALRDVAEGAVVRSEDFTASECDPAGAANSFRYGIAERAVRARQAIVAGSVVPRFAGYGAARAYAGDAMELLASSGPVTVTRKVHAIQSARERERMLVKSTDGQVFSVVYAGTAR